MKRMNLIRAALFAVFAFMGAYSVSAQGVWVTPNQAKEIIQTELNILNTVPSQPPLVVGQQSAAIAAQYAKNNTCPDCFLTKIKKEFLTRIFLKLQSGGNDTGVAVEQTRAELMTIAGTHANVQATVQQAYLYIQDKL